ncbi:zinc finger, CCHC-type containing protein [Tanacetum coccineum]
MLMTMEPEIQRNLENLHANDMLKELKTLFAQQAEQELLQTTRDFHSCKQEEGQSVSSYVLKMKGYIDNLERLGHPVTLGLAVSLILIGLRKEFDGFVQNYNMHSLGKTVNELHAMLKLHEQTLPKNNAPALHAIRAGKVQKGKKHKKPQPQMAARGQNQGNGKNKHAYAPKPKIPPPPKREDPAKDSICHECGETGHWKRNCPQYLAELLKKKKNGMIELVVVQGNLGEPANYKAALLDPKSDKWLNAMNVEMQSMKDNEVWVLIELPPNGKTVGRKWLFKKKTDMDGAVHTYKARLVVKGYTQTSGIDYEETFSHVADIRAIRILIAIAAYYDYEILQMDVKTAFLNGYLNGYLNEEVYMEQPEGFVNPKYPNKVCKLKRSIYGLKQSIFATSSTEAEYIAAFDASKEAVWVRKFISGLGVVPTLKTY